MYSRGYTLPERTHEHKDVYHMLSTVDSVLRALPALFHFVLTTTYEVILSVIL